MITYSENAIALDTAEDAVIDTRVIDVDLGTAGDSEVAEKAEKRNLQTSVDSAPAEVIKKKPLYYRFIKRTFDVVFSLVVILITFIPMLILSLFVAIDTKAFPIYSQVRVGQRGEFRFYKMRTMVKDSDDLEKYFTPAQLDLWSKEHKVPDDPRITKFGAILRATSLDELPQFFNVLIGDISAIGPRCITPAELEYFGHDVNLFLSAPAGITGAWQIGERNDATFENGTRQAIELDYCRRASLGLDFRIFLATFAVMFIKRSGK